MRVTTQNLFLTAGDGIVVDGRLSKIITSEIHPCPISSKIRLDVKSVDGHWRRAVWLACDDYTPRVVSGI